MKTKLLTLLLLFTGIVSFAQTTPTKRILVFSKTRGFRHTSIPFGIKFFQELGVKKGFAVDTTENADKFTEENLKKYSAVVWMCTTGDVLSPAQQADFERYIQAGGGYVGVHSASDTEYDWPWYNDLMGGYFMSHPGKTVSNVQNGKMTVLDKNHPSTAHMPDSFERKDEFYDYKSLKKDLLKFLITVDENSYKEGKMGDFHPMAWYHEFDGGKAFYSNFGHVHETFDEPLMAEHFWGGLKWAMAEKLDYSKAKTPRAPEENRFERTTLNSNLNEPTELAVFPNGKVIYVERKGKIWVYNPITKKNKVVGQMPVYTKFEYGLMGVGIDPNYEKNNWIYLFYTPNETREDTKDQFLSRFVYDDKKDTVVMSSEKVVLRFPVKRVECCHTGGSIDWDAQGNLFLSTGDDTNPFASDGYSPHDFRPDRKGWDGLSSPANTNDLRGKILRIKPQDDGTYTIPEGNLFPIGTEKARPEIFVMGCRNPYRIAVDKRTGWLYWGDVGPDAGKTNEKRGPEGIVEFNQAQKAGFFGWPMFTGPNFAYNKYNFETKESGEKFNPEKPINDSPNNTGLTELPPAQKAWMWYGYGDSKLFPLFGKGGANPMAGPVYYSSDYKENPKKLPSYFDGRFFAYEWMRDWIITVTMDKTGKVTGMERFMPNTKFYHPMDMAFAKDGKFYVLDYGMNWFAQNEEATLSVIEYNAGNRKPVVVAKSDVKAGAVPLKVSFSSDGTLDYDKDALKYLWNFGNGQTSTLPNPKITFTKAGIYDVKLTVTDAAGNKTSQSINIKAGNALPSVNIAVNGNKTFFFDNEKIDYEVKVSDKEDGVLMKGIDTSDVVVNINYLEGFDKTMIEQGHKENTSFAAGKRLIDLSDCKACHSVDKKSIGPAYIDVAKKYRRGQTAINQLAEKVIKGGGGVWGEQAMAAHPQISVSDARDMVDYILSLNDKRKATQPVKAQYDASAHKGKKEGAYIIQATYTDKGGKVVGPLTTSETKALRSSKVKANSYDDSKAVAKFDVPQVGEVVVISEDNAYIGFKDIDLTGVKTLNIAAFSQKGQTVGGKLEVRLGSPTGTLAGELTIPEASLMPQKLPINATGMQSVYIVGKNTNAEGKPLFALQTVEFMNK